MTRRRQNPHRRRVRKKERDSSKRLLYQLIICLVLFAATFIGRTMVPQQIRTLFHADTDFAAAFSTLGQSLSGGEPVRESLGDFAVTVFGAANIQANEAGEHPSQWKKRINYFDANREKPQSFQNAALATQEWAQEFIANETAQAELEWAQIEEEGTAEEAADVLMPVMNVPTYDGPALPEKVTMDAVTLHISGTVMPVSGVVSSNFGYRSDPLEGDNRFHYGLDIAANEGTDIVAWASGEVLYIGEGEDFGLYIKIQHENEITSFYAHCSELLCQAGDYVEAGQLIARVGSTGRSTGAHLHFELRVNEKYINPLYYLNFDA